MNIRSELQALRAEIIQNIDAAFDRFLCRLEEQEPELAEAPSPGPQEEIPYESIFKLSSNPAIFKGTSPRECVSQTAGASMSAHGRWYIRPFWGTATWTWKGMWS